MVVVVVVGGGGVMFVCSTDLVWVVWDQFAQLTWCGLCGTSSDESNPFVAYNRLTNCAKN